MITSLQPFESRDQAFQTFALGVDSETFQDVPFAEGSVVALVKCPTGAIEPYTLEWVCGRLIDERDAAEAMDELVHHTPCASQYTWRPDARAA